MPEINKSKIKSIKNQDQWNDLFKFEIKFENGSEGMMFKKTPDPMCSVGDDVMFTLSSKESMKAHSLSEKDISNNMSIRFVTKSNISEHKSFYIFN